MKCKICSNESDNPNDFIDGVCMGCVEAYESEKRYSEGQWVLAIQFFYRVLNWKDTGSRLKINGVIKEWKTK